MIRPEDDDERLPQLRERLMITGELARRPKESSSFMFGSSYEDIEPAIRRYQENNGLRVTGRVDKATLQALNVPAAARLAQLRLNLQRIRTYRCSGSRIAVSSSTFQPSSSRPSRTIKSSSGIA